MNPVMNIGRYQLPLLNVAAIEEIQLTWLGKILLWLGLAKTGYKAILTNGHVIHFTQQEKQAYDDAKGMHDLTLQFYGMARGLGLRG